MGYTVLLHNEKYAYALLDMGHQYVVVSEYDPTQPENKQWGHGTYYTHWNQSVEDKQIALFHAIEQFRLKTEPNYISRFRLEELATKLKDGLLEADEDFAEEFFDEECEMTDEEKAWFGIETESEDE